MRATQSIRIQSSGDNRYHCTKHIQICKRKKVKPKNQGNYKEIFILIWQTIEYNCRQAATIVQVHTEKVSCCSQLIIRACEWADTILYVDQQAVALLMSSLFWSQQTFCCIH